MHDDDPDDLPEAERVVVLELGKLVVVLALVGEGVAENPHLVAGDAAEDAAHGQ